jgi:hypothetical protein
MGFPVRKKKHKKRREPKKGKQNFVRILETRSCSRSRLRRNIVKSIVSEKKGFWRNNQQIVTRYRYDVECLSDGRRIYLKRPTHLNKGIDFQVFVERLSRGNDTRPSHDNLIRDLRKKAIEKPRKARALHEGIERVWRCEKPDKVIADLSLRYKSGYPLELSLKVLKWLFIEQDVTYWNYDGRKKLMSAITKAMSDSLYRRHRIRLLR